MFIRKYGRSAVVGVVAILVMMVAVESGADVGDEMRDETELPDLTGTWEGMLETTSRSDLPVLGEVTTIQRSRVSVDIRQRGEELRLRAETCSIETETDSALISTTLPRAFVESIEPHVRSGHLEILDDGFGIVVDRAWTTQGVDLEDPSRQALPEEADDPRIFDQTGDGNPGLTVRVGGIVRGDVYVVQKSWDAWRGRIGEDEIRGEVRWETEQSVVGASSRWLESQPETEPVDDPAQNRFRLRRVPPENDGC